MIFRVITIIFFLSFLSSCQYFSSKEKETVMPSESIDFSTVDTSPSFKKCANLLDDAKTNCFRITLQEKFIEKLQEYSFVTKNSIEETIEVVLHFDKEGVISIKEIESSEEINNELPKLDGDLQLIVSRMPKLQPATKRGIPVATEYKLPIQIQTTEE